MTTSYIISQSFAFVALIFTIVSYFVVSRTLLFTFQTIGNILLFLSYVFIGVTFAWIGTAVATIRTGTFALFSFKKKEMPWALVVLFIVLTLVCVILTYSSPFDRMYFIGLSVFTLSMKMRELVKVKGGMIVAILIYVIYAIILGNYVGALLQTFEFVTAIVSVVIALHKRRINKIDKNHDIEE